MDETKPGAVLYVGIDWGEGIHQVCTRDAKGHVLEQRGYAHQSQAAHALCERLHKQSHGSAEGVWIGIERNEGLLVELLVEQGFCVFFLNPRQLDRFRDRFSASGCKDDRRDADVLSHCLATDIQAYRRVEPVDPKTSELRELSRLHQDLTEQRTGLCQQFRAQLQRYYPQMLEVGVDLHHEFILQLWENARCPKDAVELDECLVQTLVRRHRIRRLNAEQVVQVLREHPWPANQATLEAACLHIEVLIALLRVVRAQLRAVDKKITLCLEALQGSGSCKEKQHDATLLQSLPGVGRVVLTVLLAEAPKAIQERDYLALRKLAGTAPVTRQTGRRATGSRRQGHVVVSMRRACNVRLRTAVFHWANVAAQRDGFAKARYQALRARGKRHATALRILADTLLRIACAMLRDGTVYHCTDPTG